MICIGAVVRGDTPHFEYVAGECAAGIARVALDTGVPVIFGVLTVDTREQAFDPHRRHRRATRAKKRPRPPSRWCALLRALS